MNEHNELRPRGIYLLPNLFTTTSLFCGFFAIVSAIGGRFEHAAIALFVAMLMDGIDGRVARWTHTESRFGAEYDSLSDMISFGIAPALVLYLWSMQFAGKIGWSAAFIYTAAAALRLARFNTQVEVQDKRFFQGLPSPAAAAMLASFLLLCLDHQLQGSHMVWASVIVTTLSGLLMVSRVRYPSFKQADVKSKVSFAFILVIALSFALFLLGPPQFLFTGFIAYLFYGLLLTAVEIRKKRLARKHL